jgi:short-subunit dehydrogenase
MPERWARPDGSAMRTLRGRVALVTGVTAGIGRCIARDLLEAEVRVIGCSRDGERLAAAAAELPGLVTLRCDVRDPLERAALVRTATQRWGRLDVLVNNAGVGYVGAVVDMSGDDVERIIGTNTTAAIDLTRLVLPSMVSRRDGDVVMVSSAAAWLALPPLTVYAASKYGVNGFVEGLRREVAPLGVRVHAINPGFVATEFHARAIGVRPEENDPRVLPMWGIDPERVSARALRELRAGRGRTVAVPRWLGSARLLSLPLVAQAVDLGLRAASSRLERLGPSVAAARTPGRSP